MHDPWRPCASYRPIDAVFRSWDSLCVCHRCVLHLHLAAITFFSCVCWHCFHFFLPDWEIAWMSEFFFFASMLLFPFRFLCSTRRYAKKHTCEVKSSGIQSSTKHAFLRCRAYVLCRESSMTYCHHWSSLFHATHTRVIGSGGTLLILWYWEFCLQENYWVHDMRYPQWAYADLTLIIFLLNYQFVLSTFEIPEMQSRQNTVRRWKDIDDSVLFLQFLWAFSCIFDALKLHWMNRDAESNLYFLDALFR